MNTRSYILELLYAYGQTVKGNFKGVVQGCESTYKQIISYTLVGAKSLKYYFFLYCPLIEIIFFSCYEIILPVVLYGCETLSLTLREEHRLRVFENRVLKRIFGPKRDEVTGGWTKLHNEELHGLYSSPSITRVIKARRMRRVGHVGRMGEVRGAYNIWEGGLKGGDH
jgi:hypothetical protein